MKIFNFLLSLQLNILNNVKPSKYLIKFLILCISIKFTYQEDEPDSLESLVGFPISPTSSCRSILGLGHPSNVFKIYFQQIINNNFINSDFTKVDLMFYKEERTNKSLHKFIFRMKNVYSKQSEHIGIISVVPQSAFDSKTLTHNIVRYVNAKDIEIVKVLIDVENVQEDDEISCDKTKEAFITSVVEQPIAPYTCNDFSDKDDLNSFDIKNMFRYNFDVLRRVLGLFKFDVKTSDLLFNKKIIQELKKNYKNANTLKKNFKILESEINPLNEVNHDDLLEQSYKGTLPKCQDDLDITQECKSMKNNECISFKEAEQIYNLMIIYYMMNTKKILSEDVIFKMKSDKFILKQIALNKFGILTIYENISKKSNNKSKEKSYNRFGVSSRLDLQFLNQIRTKFFNHVETDLGIHLTSNEVLLNELRVISEQIKLETIQRMKELDIDVSQEQLYDLVLLTNKQIFDKLGLKKSRSNSPSQNNYSADLLVNVILPL